MDNAHLVAGVPLGGRPGLHPTLLVGSMFFDRQKLVKDHATGDFDREAASQQIELQRKFSELTGNPAALDVVASTPLAMRRYLDFVLEVFEGPIFVDGSKAEVRLAGIEYLAERGAVDRAVYNSISLESQTSELEAIKTLGVKSAVLLAVDPLDLSLAGKTKLLKDPNGLLPRIKAAGVETVLVDPGIIDLPSVGVFLSLSKTVKDLGCLLGGAPHNAFGTWSGLKNKFETNFKAAATAVINALPLAWGADFVIYGPLPLAPIVFPAVAMVDTIMAQPLMEEGIIPELDHPMFRIA
ncbi:MAG: tetrahydromethanopterin S-methyltransferase subunit H [Deltaproteobacteria bacterium]|jgi:tetrahydromethanopterin S-methyltransferase subunit H